MVTPVTRRAGVRAMLDRDEAYDQDPKGEPPISVPRYRRALRAAIDVGPELVAEQGMPRSGAEAKAYSAGVRDALDTVVGAIAQEIEYVPATSPSADEPPRTER
ncbi:MULTISPECIES: hypothetical protein [Protofrankia]|uniref:Uncharacterized protein n=1 Tax=Protofrankia coriariae TaxID=1562887 RepID=A0ABR5F1C3_9ACTN|nr:MULTISPECIES: hypothetical protein [Protofrankia]KLL10443.1 hypothetical protein FrCorBMG51_17845 [Protofrankia coriariae]ONH33060.1 hypothetical protein BL254_20770 [Protofrankia sp. BMG5.30]